MSNDEELSLLPPLAANLSVSAVHSSRAKGDGGGAPHSAFI